jgi:hypothetical protein
MSAPGIAEPTGPATRAALTTLRRVAAYRLPPALDRRLLDLGEREESLTPDERDELLAWVAFAEERSVEKAQAEVALRRLVDAFPELAGQP